MGQITVTMEEAYPLCMDILKGRKVPFLSSSPGIGKSALAKKIAKANNLTLVDIRLSQCEPTDLMGFPTNLPITATGVQKAGYIPMNMFPIEGDAIPEGSSGWLVLLDEFNSCPLAVQAAAYKVVLDRMVGMHRLHTRCLLMTAGNLATDKAIVLRMSTAMQSRLIHLVIRPDLDCWIKWADEALIDYRIRAFLNFKPDLLHKFDPNHSDLTFGCPRTWEFLSDIIKPWKDMPLSKLPILAGTVGEGSGREFYSYSQIFDQIPTFDKIMKNPETVPFGDEPGMQYALVGLISDRINLNNAESCIKFVTRLGIDFQVVALRSAIRKHRELLQHEKVQEWITKNTKELVNE